MHISIRAFASYREAVGSPRMELDLPEGATPSTVWEHLADRFPRLKTLPEPFAFAVNDQYVDGGTILNERDELVLIPPVSGGTTEPTQPTQPTRPTQPAPWVALTDKPIDANVLLERVRHPDAGAVVLFLGTVRDHNYGRSVRYLEYEVYQALALREMARVASEAAARWPLLGIAMEHRVGHLNVGDISVAIAVAAGHRREAFEAGRYAIDTLKQTVPIWKKEFWDSGEEWVGQRPR
ncbi:MAG: molybdenum cofactor biosynthesis protein MoaE [Gammaproteobacteria bacterium]